MALPKPGLVKTNLTSNSNISQVRQWTAIQVAEWMGEVNDNLFANYTDNVLLLKINGTDLMNLTANDMKTKLGITIPNHITTLCATIERLKKKAKRRRAKSPTTNKNKKVVNLNDIPDANSSSNSIDNVNSYSMPLNTTNKKKKTHLKKAKSMMITHTTSVPIFTSNANNKQNDQQLIRSYTVQSNNFNDDHKSSKSNTEMELKRVLTNQNLDKKDKYIHKDLGKKLWPKETSNITKEGWMKKRGVRRSGFKERWCVLRDNGHLYYFEKRPTKNDLPQGLLDLRHALKIEYLDDNQDPNTFNIKTHDRNWIFSAMSGGQLVEWMSCLNKNIQTLNQ